MRLIETVKPGHGCPAWRSERRPDDRRSYTVQRVKHWDLRTLDVQPHQPQILDSSRGESRTIAIHLPAGERLQEHQVHERALLVVVDGEIAVDADDGSVRGGSGFAAVFDPQERHEVHAETDARLLLVLAPWPGEGHYRGG